ncbi:MAG: homoserine dehydrogenase [Chloroflexi bacterium]|nr:homoserine dehydrogenase [Chloroflexota bacterium]
MSHHKLAFLGFGNVGRALAELLLRKRDELGSRHGITFSVTGIATGSHGAAVDPDGLDLTAAVRAVESGGSLEQFSKAPTTDTMSFLRATGADVMFENTPVNYQTGQPAIDYIRAALNLGMHVCTANKGPVVHAYDELSNLAASQRLHFFHESTVMDGAPIFSLFRHAIPVAQLKAFRGVLNSTTNLMLTRMEGGESFDEAVRYCQQVGIAETDPSGDVDGWDAAIKVAALVTVLMDVPLKPQDVQREGIRGITPEKIAAALADGKRWKLVCSARREEDRIVARVQPELVGPDSPMFSVDGTTSIVEFETDVLGDLSIVEANPGPHTTAYGLLADFINAVS